MRLDTEFIKLPLRFDTDRLRHELAQFGDDEWMGHATGYDGNLSIPLVSLYGEFSDAMHGPMAPTSALDRCEYVQQIMSSFDEVFSRSRLMRLEPGHDVPAHADVNYHWYSRVRVHIPITTNEQVLFYCGDKHVHMAAGECWIFNTWNEHTVQNRSDESRVHLVLDTAGSPRFWDMAARGEWPFSVHHQSAAAPTMLDYIPGQPVRIRTENFNAPLVQSPGELENLIRGLLDDLDPATGSSEDSHAKYRELATAFVRSWREVWSEHGMKPGGWPHYHRLVNVMYQTMTAFDPELTLASNGAEAGLAFRGLVLFSAINEEFAPQYLGPDEVPETLAKTARSFTANATDAAATTTDNTVLASGAAASNSVPKTGVVGRNDPCTCGSGKRYKHCHGRIV